MFKKNIIVTGGLGFIGTNLIFNLVKSGYNVLNLDKNSVESNNALISYNDIHYKYHKINLSLSKNKHQILRIINKFAPQVIINLASVSHVDKSIDTPEKIYISNVNSTLNLLTAINKSVFKKNIKLIHIGSDEIYGDLNLFKKKKFNENSTFSTSNPYSASKASQINLVQAFVKTFGLKAVIVNPCNNYGFYQYQEKLIPRSLGLMISNRPVQLYGNGNQIRDWIFVEDTVKAIKCLINKKLKKNIDIYNLSANFTTSNRSLIKKIFKIIKKKRNLNKLSLRIKYVVDRPGHDIKYASSNKKFLKIGWKPKTTLNDGLKKTIDFYIKNRNIFRNKNYLKRQGIIK